MTQGDGKIPDASGVDLQPDVERLHRAIRREPSDPTEGREPAPWYFVAAIAISLFWGGWYLGRHGGEFSNATHLALGTRDVGTTASAANQNTLAIDDPLAAGEAVFEKHCVACHQSTGLGIPGAFPPVVGSEWVTGDAGVLIRILLHGMQGPVVVAGATYNGAMPAWRDVLKDGELAAVATYMRQWEGNDASAIDPAIVSSLRIETADRTTAYTAAELLARGDDDEIDDAAPPAAISDSLRKGRTQ